MPRLRLPWSGFYFFFVGGADLTRKDAAVTGAPSHVSQRVHAPIRLFFAAFGSKMHELQKAKDTRANDGTTGRASVPRFFFNLPYFVLPMDKLRRGVPVERTLWPDMTRFSPSPSRKWRKLNLRKSSSFATSTTSTRRCKSTEQGGTPRRRSVNSHAPLFLRHRKGKEDRPKSARTQFVGYQLTPPHLNSSASSTHRHTLLAQGGEGV